MFFNSLIFLSQSGHNPRVRVWELGETVTQVAELDGHKFSINCVVRIYFVYRTQFLEQFKCFGISVLSIPPSVSVLVTNDTTTNIHNYGI